MAKQFVQLADGTFAEAQVLTKAQANNLVRAPQVRNAFLALTKKNEEVTDWLVDNQDAVESAFDAGTIRRVSKAERKALTKALSHIAEVLATDTNAEFVVKHRAAIVDTFKWPNQKRIAEEDKAAAIETAFMEATGDNEKLVDWIIKNKDGIEMAYATGIVKREVPQATLDALAEHRAKVAAAKEAAAAKKADAAE